jgi:hypothetical protein
MSDLDPRRIGCMTASMAAVIMGADKTEGLKKYVRELAGERVFGPLGEEGFKSKWTDRGHEQENDALSWFEFDSGLTFERQPFVPHPSIPYVAATPDGLLRSSYTVEAKSPSFAIWCETREAVWLGRIGLDAVPSQYRHQCRWQCWCAGVPEGRFVAYHPAGGGQGIVVPYTITDEEIAAMQKRVVTVEGMIRNWVEILRG